MSYNLKYQNEVPEKSMPDTYYQKGVEGFISQAGYFIHSAANWRFFALSMLAVNVLCLASVVYFATRATLVPYIVEVDNTTGAVISTSKVLTRSEASRQEIEYFLWELIKKVRTIPKDMVLYERNWKDAYTFLNNETSQKMNDMAVRENHKGKFNEGVTTMLTLRSITAVSGREDTYNIRWQETWYNNGGGKMNEYFFEAYFTVGQVGLDPETVYTNPLGIVIKDFNMSQVQ